MNGQTLSETISFGAGVPWPEDGSEDWQQLAKIVFEAQGLDACSSQIVALLEAEGHEATVLDFNALGEGRRWILRVRVRSGQQGEVVLEVAAFWHLAKGFWELEELRRVEMASDVR